MKAVVIREFGPPTVFEQTEIPKPGAKANHVVIQVQATSVNQIDCKIRAGLVPDVAPQLPAILHGDVAGVIVEVGTGVHDFKIGDQVYACAGGVRGRQGALAEHMLVDSACIAKKPNSLSFIQAAALPLVTITAWTALFLKARVQPRCNLLIHGGVGGVGHVAVQLAKWAGARITATVGSDTEFDLARQLGADHVVNFRKETVPEYVKNITEGRGFDVIFDTVGGKNLDLSFQAAAFNGIIATTAARSTNDLTPLHRKGLSLHVIFMLIPLLHQLDLEHQGEILKKAAKLVDEKKLFPLVDDHMFSISSVAEAHTYLESGKAKGKVVLSW
jgi:NADPH2:quinone reductase